jgi:acyl-CoA synthetase (NDP forming)
LKYKDLSPLLNPDTIAIVGASSNPLKVGGRPITALRDSGFVGTIVPVNAHRDEVQGLPASSSLSAYDGQIDLAIVAAPAPSVVEIVTDGIAAGVKAFVIFTSGFAEQDAAGAQEQEKLTALADAHDVAILGPNCLGAVNTANGMTATFTSALERDEWGEGARLQGAFGIVSQSGALASWWLALAVNAGIGISSWLTTGNECDVDVADGLAALAVDPQTKVIGLYAEGVRDRAKFDAAAQLARDNGKLVIALKAGQTEVGAAAAAAHTGADSRMAEDEVDRWFDDLGIVRVQSMSAALNTAKVALAYPGMKPFSRLGIVTTSGGAGVLIADDASRRGFDLSGFSEPVQVQLRDLLPPFVGPRNPLDVTAGVVGNPQVFADLCDLLGDHDEHDFYLISTGLLYSVSGAMIDGIKKGLQAKGKPAGVIWVGASNKLRRSLEDEGIPVFTDLPEAIEALGAWVKP